MFKSFICYQGRDTGQRLAAIVATIYILLIAISSILSASFVAVLGVMFAVVAGFSSLRRVHDAQCSPSYIGLVLAPLLSFLLLLILEAAAGYLIINMVIATVLIAFIVIKPAAKARLYQLGYDGPANEILKTIKVQRQRVEPTILHSQSDATDLNHEHQVESLSQAELEVEQEASENDQPSFQGFPQAFPLWVHQALAMQPKIIAANFGVLAVMWVILLWPAGTPDDMQDSNTAPSDLAELAVDQQPEPTPTVQASLPDGLGLRLQGNVLILRWLGEEGSPRLLWSQATAEGDKSCAYAEFNNGSRYRPIDVVLTADSATEARFSPLDTQAVVKDVAMRGNVKLCGYRFSLKGSQAALTKVDEFARYIE